jgi:hypothetical protein
MGKIAASNFGQGNPEKTPPINNAELDRGRDFDLNRTQTALGKVLALTFRLKEDHHLACTASHLLSFSSPQ